MIDVDETQEVDDIKLDDVSVAVESPAEETPAEGTPSEETPAEKILASYECSLCPFSSKQKGWLNRHTKEKHIDNQSEDKIDHFEQPASIAPAQDLQKEPDLFRCDQCPYTSRYERSFTRHQNSFHPSGSSDDDDDAIQIIEPLTNTTSYLPLVNDSSVNNNIITGTMDQERPFACSWCIYRTKRRHHLLKHELRHLEKRYVCYVCDHRAETEDALKLHQQTLHDPEKPFACDKCDFRTARKYTLKVHMIKGHSSEAPFTCDKCDFQTKTKEKLIQHCLVHNSEKQVASDLCDIRKVTKVNLVKHKLIHINREQVSFPCHICKKDFKQSFNLKRHLKTQHPG